MTSHGSLLRTIYIATLSLMLIAQSSVMASAQEKLEGVIKGRSGATVILQRTNLPDVIVLLTDNTDVGQVKGALKARKKTMSMAALVPGLPIKVEGTYDAENQLVAKKIRFKGNDLQQAQAIQAGLAETSQRSEQNKEELEKQNAELKKQNEAIVAATARFGQLNDYYILDEVTVYFGNGKVNVDPKYKPQLAALAEKAKTIKGYMIQIKGFASTSGSTELNQKLSEDRARNVSNILLQECDIPLTNMLAPGAMGESQQVDKGTAADTEAANRRVVVRILQNKAIAGT